LATAIVRETEEEASASGLLFRLFPATIHIVFRLGRRHGETHSTAPDNCTVRAPARASLSSPSDGRQTADEIGQREHRWSVPEPSSTPPPLGNLSSVDRSMGRRILTCDTRSCSVKELTHHAPKPTQ